MRQQFVDPVDGMIVDACDDFFKPCPRINPIHFAGTNEAIDFGKTLCAEVTPGKQVVLPTDGYRTDTSLHGVIIGVEHPVGSKIR